MPSRVADLGHSPAAVVERTRPDLASEVAAEDRSLTDRDAQPAQPVLDRAVELPDRLVAVALGRSTTRRRLFEAEEHLERLRPERTQRQFQRPVAVRQPPGMARQHVWRGQPRLPADSIEQVRGQGQVDHLLDENAAHHLNGLRVPLRVDRVERAQVRRKRGVLQLDRPLKVLAEVLERFDRRRRRSHFRVLHRVPPFLL
jgi:hypothetical protein